MKLTQLAIAGSLSLVVTLAASFGAKAQLRNEYTLQQAQSGAISIQVWPGSGTNLDFTFTGEYIYRAWLDDPSRIQLDTDTPIENANATIIHLRKIDNIDFDGLPATGVTLLSVATINAAGGRNLYQFPVSYGDNRPTYSTIALVPQTVMSPTEPISAAYGNADLETFRQGIAQLILNGTIQGNGPMHDRLKTFVAAVRSGSSPTEAAQTAGVDQAVIQEVARIGLQAAAEEARSRFDEVTPEPEGEPAEAEGILDQGRIRFLEPIEPIDADDLMERLRQDELFFPVGD